MSETYTFGQGVLGQLGHGDDKGHRVPRLVVAFMAVKIKQIACGNQHTCFLLESGEIYACGRSNFGQLGLGAVDGSSVLTPTAVQGLDGKVVRSIAVGWYHTAALTDAQELYTWGSGEYGRLGHGDETRQMLPKLVEDLTNQNVVGLACGGFHTAAYSLTGQLWTWGGGYFGQLGHGDEENRRVPKLVKGLRTKVVTNLACGTHHTGCLTEAGEVFTWGSGEYGKLGHGNEEKQLVPLCVESLIGKGIVSVSCGGFHTAALSDKGILYTWGGGDKGQLGLGDDSSQPLPTMVESLRGKRVEKVACGMHHTIALTDIGEVFTWGHGEYGRLGHDDENTLFPPTQVEFLQGRGVVDIAAGGFHTVVIAAGDDVPAQQQDQRGRPMANSKAARSFVPAAKKVDFDNDGDKPGGKITDEFEDEDTAPIKERKHRARLKVDDDSDDEDWRLRERLAQAELEKEQMHRKMQAMVEDQKLEQNRLEGRLQSVQEDKNHLRKQLDRLTEKQKLDASRDAQIRTLQDDLKEIKQKSEKTRNDLKQKVADVHMLQVRVSQLCGSELEGLTVSQLEELERIQTQALRQVSSAKYSRLRQEFHEREDRIRDDTNKMRRELEDKMTTMNTELNKIQEEKTHLMGLEQRLRQEFQTQVQAEQMSNEELRVRLETLQDGFVQLRSMLRKDKQNRQDIHLED